MECTCCGYVDTPENELEFDSGPFQQFELQTAGGDIKVMTVCAFCFDDFFTEEVDDG